MGILVFFLYGALPIASYISSVKCGVTGTDIELPSTLLQYFILTKTILCLRPLHDVKSDSHSVAAERSISLPLTKTNTHTHTYVHSNNVKHNDIYVTWLQIIQNTTRAEIIKTLVKKKTLTYHF